MRAFLATFLFLCAALSTLHGQSPQQEGSRDEPAWVPNTSETPSRSTADDAELYILRRSVTDTDRGARISAVRRIEEMVRGGRFDPSDPTIIALLRRVALAPTLIERRGEGNADFPIARMHAVRALSRMEGAEVRATLLQVLRSEEDPIVLAEALRALAALRAYPDEPLTDAINEAILRNRSPHLDARLGMALLDAVQVLDGVGAGIQSRELYRLLVEIALNGSTARLRKRAYVVVDELRGR